MGSTNDKSTVKYISKMSKYIILFILYFVLQISAKEGLDVFQKFKSDFGRQYATEEEESVKFNIFLNNLEKIREHNSRPEETWKMAVTEFADMTEEQFRDNVVGQGYIRTPANGQGKIRNEILKLSDLPDHVDWREAGVITETKNQGSCGSCWAFASLTKLSAQEITTCTPNPLHCGGTGGCRGSIPQLGYNYVQLFGLATNDDYPYWSGVTGLTGRCKYDVERRTPVVGITGYDTLAPNDLAIAMDHLANIGPLAVAADASRWQLYGSGVFTGCQYDQNINLNHAIQLVGYGTDEEHGDYWLIRNSWGDYWGEQGYIRLQRETEAVCGLDSTPMSGTACVDGPGSESQEVCGMCGVLYDMSYPLGAGEWTLPGQQ